MKVNAGIDTVRFVANLPNYELIENPVTGELVPQIRGIDSVRLSPDGNPIFEFSAYKYYNQKAGFLAPPTFLSEIYDFYGADYIRIDVSAQMEMIASMEKLSYLRWYGRRSLQKKSQPWAFWPSEKKTVKFYNKVDDLIGKKKPVPDNIRALPLRFEVEYRNPDVKRIFKDGVFDVSMFQRDFDHLYHQLPKFDKKPLTRMHYTVLGMFQANQLELLNWKQKKALEQLDSWGYLKNDMCKGDS